MKDFRKLITECMNEVKEAGITPGNIVEWSVNYRAKRRWGLCSKSPDGKIKIQIASRLLIDDRVSVTACKETMIHEILHSVEGGMGHTGKWKQLAEVVNQKYGYSIKRTTSSKEKGLA